MENNQITVVGLLTSNFVFSHEACKEKFFSCEIVVERESGTKDTLPIIISERLIEVDHTYDKPVHITGQLRSYNKTEGEKRFLVLYIFVSEFSKTAAADPINEVTLSGTLCKAPVFRSTPSGRQVADLMVAVKRAYGKNDYIPCICWGRNAQYVSNLTGNEQITLTGRFQSRTYEKKYADHTEIKTAYEVSANWVDYEKVDNDG